MYNMPVGYTLYGQTGDQATYIYTGHTAMNPRLTIFDRKAPALNNGQLSVPTYRVRTSHRINDADGMPIPTQILADLTIRWPAGATKADVKAVVARLAAIISSADWQEDALDEQLFPTGVATS